MLFPFSRRGNFRALDRNYFSRVPARTATIPLKTDKVGGAAVPDIGTRHKADEQSQPTEQNPVRNR